MESERKSKKLLRDKRICFGCAQISSGTRQLSINYSRILTRFIFKKLSKCGLDSGRRCRYVWSASLRSWWQGIGSRSMNIGAAFASFSYKFKALFRANKKPTARVYEHSPKFERENSRNQGSGQKSPKQSPRKSPSVSKQRNEPARPAEKRNFASYFHDLKDSFVKFVSGTDNDPEQEGLIKPTKGKSDGTATSPTSPNVNRQTNYDVEATGEDDIDSKEDTKLLQDEDDEKEVFSEETKGTTSSLQAGWNISNLIQGTGTLGIPYAISQGGYASVFAMVFVALLTNYTGKLIIECLYAKQRGVKVRVRQGYADLGEHCWPSHGKTIVGCAQVLHLFSALVLYLLLISDFLNDIWPHPVLRPSCWTAIAGILVLPSVFINDLSRISWLSMFSVFALLFVFTSTIGYSISEYHTWDLDALPFFSPEGFPVAWCIILFSFVSHPYLPSVEEKMKSPERFPLVMNICYAIAMVFKIAFGTLAVLTFKTDTMQEVSENLPFGPLKSAIDTFLGFNGMFSYALPSFALINIIDKCNLKIIPPCYSTEEYKLSNKELCVNSSLRVLLVMLSVTVAIMVPEFSLLMAVVGSVSAVALVLVFPALFHLNLLKNEITNVGYVVDVSIITIGFFSTIFGLFFSVKKLVNVYKLDF